MTEIPGDDGAEDGGQQYYSEPIRTMFGLTDADLVVTPQEGQQSNISFISYHPPSEESSQLARNVNLPPGFPTDVAEVWDSNQSNDRSRYLHTLTAHDLSEIRDALRAAKGLPFDQISRSTFPLPRLSVSLDRIRDEVYSGIGFGIIRGWNPDDFVNHDGRVIDHEERAIIFVGLSSYIAEERGPQDRHGTMLKHIMDDEQSESLRELPFHTDVTCDVSALLAVRCSDRGGEWTVASSFRVYNELARTRPNLIRILAKPDWPFDTFERNPPYIRRAPLYFCDGKPIFNFSRRLLVGHPKFGRSKGVPRLTKAQAEALNAVHHAARRNCMIFDMQEGDIRFVSNLGLLHGREGFHDDDGPESRRHVMRLWLRSKELTWKLPSALQLVWARIFDDPQRRREWIVEPFKKNGVWHGRGPRAECD